MHEVGVALRSARVRAIYLTASGVDLDALGELARIFPSGGDMVRCVSKRFLSEIRGDAGSYTESFARTFESMLNQTGDEWVPVGLFPWSGENHHIGRADGAVRLIDELASLECEPGDRVLIWGHGHGGNVLALATNLLAGDAGTIEKFFRAAEIYYRLPIFGWIDIPVWNRVRSMLLDHIPAVRNLQLDIVTFGTPVRYGWDCDGYSSLLHFIHRRPAAGAPVYRAGFPVKCDDVLNGAHGDYVQQFGIAGTNNLPSVSSWRVYLADRRLQELLEGGELQAAPLERFRTGTIVPEDGTTLLVDYGLPDGEIGRHLAGHAVYAHKRWLLFHAEEVARRLYAARACRAA